MSFFITVKNLFSILEFQYLKNISCWQIPRVHNAVQVLKDSIAALGDLVKAEGPQYVVLLNDRNRANTKKLRTPDLAYSYNGITTWM